MRGPVNGDKALEAITTELRENGFLIWGAKLTEGPHGTTVVEVSIPLELDEWERGFKADRPERPQ